MFSRITFLILACFLSAGWSWDGGWDAGDIPGSAIKLNVDNFNGNLSSSDTDVQTAFETFDSFTVPPGYTDPQAQTATGWTKTATNVYLTTSTDNVGIGTSLPRAEFDLQGDMYISGNITGENVMFGTIQSGSHSLFIDGTVHLPTITATDKGISFLDTSIYTTGNIGIGTSTPTARINISAGSTVAGTAPIKLTSGSLLATPEAGAIEFLVDDFFVTKTTSDSENWASTFPPAHNTTYVKSTTEFAGGTYSPFLATDPASSITGGANGNTWLSVSGTTTNQRFHIDLGSAKIVTRIYIENYHSVGANTNGGAKTFTFWGSNSSGDFADLTYANDGTWVQIPAAQSTFEQHTSADVADPKYITVTNATEYRYYAVKIADNWGNTTYVGFRRIQLQTGDSGTPGRRKLVLNGDNTNVGIGTTAQRAMLDVDGSVYLNGNVGIATTTPVNKLDIYGGQVIGTSYAGSIIAPTNGLLVSGNVGIGTSITRAKLDVEGTAYLKGNVGIGTVNPMSTLDVNGSLRLNVTETAVNLSLNATHHTVMVTGTTTITLPTAVGITGRQYNVINSGTGTVTIATTGGQTIRGEASLEMYDQGSVVVISNGANWERGS